MKCIALVICLASTVPILRAESLPAGTWVLRENKDGTNSTMINSTMIIEAAGSGVKITRKTTFRGGGTNTMVCTTQGDGKDEIVFMDGKPSGMTMAIRRVDDRHSTAVGKLGPTVYMNQKSEVSADGKVMTTESTPVSPPGPKTVEYWDKK